MRTLLPQIRRVGFAKKPTWLYLLIVVLAFAPTILAQEKTERAIDSLLGVGIGDSLDEARVTLAKIGTGGGRDTRDGGRKEAWTLTDPDYATLAFKTDGKGRVSWVSVFVRQARDVSFSKLGDARNATSISQSEAIWNIETPQGGYRLVAKGANGKANVVYLLSLSLPEIH